MTSDQPRPGRWGADQPRPGRGAADEPRPGRWAAVARASLAPARAFQAPSRTPLLQVLKTAVAAVVAWAVCSFVSSGQPPLFGAIAAIIVVQPSVNQSLSRAIERSIGVIAGVVVAYLVSLVFGAPSWLILLAIVVSLLVGWALRFPQSSTCRSRSARCWCSRSAPRPRATRSSASSRR